VTNCIQYLEFAVFSYRVIAYPASAGTANQEKKMTTRNGGFSKQRRKLVQGVALSTVALGTPSIASAIYSSTDNQSNQPSTSTTPTTNIHLELVESKLRPRSGPLARVRITNNSTTEVQLRHLSPGAITTRKGVYQINAMLQQNPISIRPNGVYQFWVKPDKGTQAHLSTRPEINDPTASTGLVKFSVVTETASGRQSRSQWVQAIA